MFHTVASLIIVMIGDLFSVLCFVSPIWSKHIAGYFYENKNCCSDVVPYSRESIWPAQLWWCIIGHEKRTVGFGQRKTLRRSTAIPTVSNKIVVWECILIKICNVRFSFVTRTLRCSCTVMWQHYMTADWQTLSVNAFLPVVAMLQAAVDCRAFGNIVTVLFLLMVPNVGKSTALMKVPKIRPLVPMICLKMRMEHCQKYSGKYLLQCQFSLQTSHGLARDQTGVLRVRRLQLTA